MLWCAAMLQQPRVPPTGQRQATEINIKWKEVLNQKTALLNILSRTTGHSVAKLDKVPPPPTPAPAPARARAFAARARCLARTR